MPLDLTKPFERITKPAPTFDPNKPFDVVKGAGRDTSRDSYEAQLADLGLTAADVEASQRSIDRRSDLLAQQTQAGRTGAYWEGVANRAGALERNVVEPLTRPLSGAVGRAADVLIPGAPVAEPLLQQPGINLPRAGAAETVPGQVAAGAYNAVADLLAGLSSPDAVALLPAAANKTVLTAWISQMAGHSPQRVLAATERFKAGDTQGGVREVVAGLGELGMAEMGRRHVMGGERLTAADIEGMPKVLPVSPDVVARNLAAPGTLRPTEQRALASPLEGRQPAEVFMERTPILNKAGEVVDVQLKPRIRQIVIEDPQLIEPVTRFVKPDVEGGMLPERRQGFQRTAEDFIEARPQELQVDKLQGAGERVTEPATLNQKPAPVLKEVIESGKIQEEGRQTLLKEDRPAQTIEAPQPPAAGVKPAPETVLTEKPAVAQSARPETITAPDARRGAESPDGRGLQTTERMAVATAEAAAPVKAFTQQAQAGKKSAAALEAVRPPDILDFIEQEIGPIKKKGGQHQQGLYDAEDYSMLLRRRRLADKIFSRSGTGVDIAAQIAFDARQIKEPTPDALWNAMERAASARAEFYRTRGGREVQLLREMGRQADNFQAAQRPTTKRDALPAGELSEGSRFKLKGEDFEVTKIEFSPETLDPMMVTVKDGPKFGEQTLAADTVLRIDKKSLKQPGAVDAFNPEASAKPGIVSGTKAEAWADRTIAESRGRVNTGLDPELMAAYMTKGVALLERGTRDFAAWARKMIAEHGDGVRPHLRTLFEQSQRTLAQLTVDGRKMRSVSKRGAESDQLPDAARAQLGVDPQSFYQTQKVRTIEDAVAQMSNAELRTPLDLSKQADQQNYVARQLELSRRLMAEPATRSEGYQVFQSLSEQGTAMGQLINQFKLLRNQTPDGLLNVINGMLARQNARPLTPEQRVQLRVLAGRNLKDVSAWRAAEEAWAANPTRGNVRKVIDAQAAAEASGRLFNERVQRIVPRGFWDTATAMMLGNKLSILSQERNVIANIALMPLKMASRLPAATIDMLDAMVRNKPREVALTGAKGFAGTAQGAASAMPEAVRVMLRGSVKEGLARGEGNVNMRPLVALKELLTGELLGNKSLAQKLALLAEASPPAYFATGYLRGLAALDLPSRQAAFGRLVAEQLTLEHRNARSVARALERKPGRTPEEDVTLAQMRAVPKPSVELIRNAVRAPELFVKPDALARIRKEALGSVFQDPNAFTRAVLGIERIAPEPIRFMLRAVVPFVSTPVNIAGKMLAYSPAGFFTHAARHALKGDGRAAKLAAGEAIVGSLLWTAGLYLWDKGVISPPLDSADEQQKMRALQGEVMPPNHVNIDGLNRLFAGEDPAWRPGDKTVDFTYYGSLAGAQMQIIATIKRQQEKNPAPETPADAVAQWVGGAVQGAGDYMVNQTFMQGTRDLLDAFRSERKFDEFLSRYAMSIADTALPRQMESVNKAVREYQREVKDDALDKRLQNQLANRLGLFTTKDDALPFKRDVWGRPLRETPEGSNPWVYQLFDVGRGRVIPDDPLKLEIYNLARRTADPRAIPTPPDATVEMMGKTYRLTAAQKSELQELVGNARVNLAQRIITPEFLKLPDEAKLEVLSRAWSMGQQFGTLAYVIRNGADLTEQPKPMGRR